MAMDFHTCAGVSTWSSSNQEALDKSSQVQIKLYNMKKSSSVPSQNRQVGKKKTLMVLFQLE
jgi:hypothetical protein